MFARPTVAQLRQRVEADVAARLGLDALLPRSVLQALARALAGSAHELHGHLAWSARQIIPDTAEAEFLERWAELYDVPRRAATFAEALVALTGANGASLPVGAQLQRVNGQRYETLELVTIAAGVGSVRARAIEAGSAANPSAGEALTLTSPVAGIASLAVVSSLELEGADAEDDEQLLARLRDRLRSQPHGGAAADYHRWALEVPGITRAWVFPLYLDMGTVAVFVATDDELTGPQPTPAKVAEVQAYIDERRPVTAQATVLAPDLQAIDLEVELTPDTAAVRAEVLAALEGLLVRDGAPGGVILLSRIREAISTAPGELDHELVVPVANVVLPAGILPVLGVVTWS